MKFSIPTNMRKAMLLLFLGVCFLSSVQAQRIAYVDVDQILESFDEYIAAQTELDQLAARWREDIAKE